MQRVFTIAWKDLRIVFRDPAALVIMLITPLALTFAIAFAFGGLMGGNTGIQNIPVILVNQDTGQFGQYIVAAFNSKDVANLVNPSDEKDPAAARKLVDENKAVAAVIIPHDFSSIIMPVGDTNPGISSAKTSVEIYENPSSPYSASVVKSITDQVLGEINAGRIGGQLAVTRLIESGLVSSQQMSSIGQSIGQSAGQQSGQTNLITIHNISSPTSQSGEFDWMGYYAPSMAILFLMFTVSSSSRTILAERDAGTLARMLISPTTTAQVIGGKIMGVFITGVTQMSILFIACRLLFDVVWGPTLLVIPVILSVAAAATSWGILIAAFSRTPGQAGSMGAAIALVFGAMSGNFFPRTNLPSWLQSISYIAPNSWGLDAFSRLASGGELHDVLPAILALCVMAIILFGISILAFRRQYTA
jgi:ABC-2 type transport system permease protein